MLRRLLLVIGFVAVAATPGKAAIVLFDNFGPGNSYQTNVGWTISSSGSSPGLFTQGEGFIPSATALLNSINVAAGLVTGPNDITFDLRANSGGVPGALIESFHAVNQMGSFGSNNPPLVLTSTLHPLLTAGQTYWLIARATGVAEWSAWNLNSTGGIGPHATSTDGVTFSVGTNTQGAFRILGDPVPEPATMAVFGALALGAFGFRRKLARA
jgi:PEP-CTERM motif